jgi:hypothetical protein
MQIDNQTIVLSADLVVFLFKVGIIILAVFYFLFSLIVIRQVVNMTDTIASEAAPLLRAFSIVHAGVALGVIILFISFI